MAKLNLKTRIDQAWTASKGFWEASRGWLLFALFLAIVILLAVLAWTGVIETGFGEYAPDPNAKPDPERAKTLWDWLDLLLVPALLAIGAWFLNREAREREHRTELDRSRQSALETYLDRVTPLLRDKWRESGGGFVEANIIRAQTLTALQQLDGERKGLLLQFLYESGLIGKGGRALVDLRGANLRGVNLRGASLGGVNLFEVDLGGADLRWADLGGANLWKADLEGAKAKRIALYGANLRGARLHGANLSEAILVEADFRGADLSRATLHAVPLFDANLSEAHLSRADLRLAGLTRADLTRADLSRADLSRAVLHEADLTKANLTKAKVTDEQLAQAKSLEGATLPDGTVHD